MALGTTGGSFKTISEEDIVTRRSSLNQLVDVIQEDVSGSITRRKYQVFVTGGEGPGVTSSLFQTVHDQDFTLQTANPILDLTVGLFQEGELVVTTTTGNPVEGKLLFPAETLMMREKIDIYKQYAANLLGNAASAFYAPYGDVEDVNRIDEALFISFKRLFTRDRIKRETFAMRTFRSGALDLEEDSTDPLNPSLPSPLDLTSNREPAILTDLGAASNIISAFGGEVGTIVNASDTTEKLGLIFYEHGTVVLDTKKLFREQTLGGRIKAVKNIIDPLGEAEFSGDYRDLLVSGSVDQIVDYVASTRMGDGTQTCITFQNVTNINSTLVFCRASADEFNYSTNPTYTNDEGRIVVIDAGQEDVQRSFTFVTTIGLHDDEGRLLAVAKLSRPIEKSDEKDLTVRVRLDF
jgi:hypothetical protein